MPRERGLYIAVLHNAVESGAPSLDDEDTLTQCRAIEEALQALGHTTKRVVFDPQKGEELFPFDLVFNLVEAVNGSSREIYLAPLLCEEFEIPVTGTSSEALRKTTDKIVTKEIVSAAGIRTPAWASPWRSFPPVTSGKFIIKPRYEDASLGIGAASVVETSSEAELLRAVETRSGQFEMFAEQFVPHREFNVGLWGAKNALEVLPVAEIDFGPSWDGRDRLLDYAAKWDESSSDYQDSLPTFKETRLGRYGRMDELKAASKAACDALGVSGYARVDMRADAEGAPWLIEINCDPGISPGAGFVKACEEAGYTYNRMIERIIGLSLKAPLRHLYP